MISMLIVRDGDGEWARRAIGALPEIHAPHHMPFEAGNVMWRRALYGALAPEEADAVHAELLDFPVQLWPYDVVASRAWSLRANATIYDAAYLALAELLDVPLLTLDRRMAELPGLGCEVRTPETL